ncbi:MAG: MFS transporter [Desulfosarcina sp.]|nr:MFS transporter [Desulfobacterales bacterium]
MQDFPVDDCPLPEPFTAKVGLVLFLAWLFYLGFVTRVMFAPLMPAIEQDLGISHGQAGSLFLMMSLGYLLAPFFSGLLSSKIKHRGTLNVSAWMVGLALLPFGVVTELWAIRLLLAIIGLAAGLHLPSAIATITAQIRKEDWGKALSVHQAAPPLSFISAPLIAALLLNWFSWRRVLMLWAVVALLSAIAYRFGGRGGKFAGQLPNRANVRIIVSNPSFWIMVALFAMAMGGNAGIYAMLPLFLVNDHQMTLTWANSLVGISQISGLLMVFVAGWVIDRVGQKRVMAVCLLAAGIATMLIGLLKGAWLIAAIIIQPAVLNAFFPAAFAALSRIAPPYLRSVTSALGPPLSFLIGGGVLPMVIGAMGQTYTFGAGIVLAGGFMLIGPLLIRFLKLGQFDDQAGC